MEGSIEGGSIAQQVLTTLMEGDPGCAISTFFFTERDQMLDVVRDKKLDKEVMIPYHMQVSGCSTHTSHTQAYMEVNATCRSVDGRTYTSHTHAHLYGGHNHTRVGAAATTRGAERTIARTLHSHTHSRRSQPQDVSGCPCFRPRHKCFDFLFLCFEV